MSYCRFAWGGSDAYVIETDEGFTCYCKGPGIFVCQTPEEMIAHLGEHKRAGLFIPPHAIADLWADIPGPNEPVHPEPAEFTETRDLLAAMMKKNESARIAKALQHEV